MKPMEDNSPRESEGWERRYIAHGARIDEAIELYSSLGYEVMAEPLIPGDLDSCCRDCALLATCEFKIIYTRRRDAAKDDPKWRDITEL